MSLATGARGTVSAVVTEADTALAAGSGDVPVLATPRLLALAEAATVAAIAPHLARGQTSVGTAVHIEHRRATPVGAQVTADAELTSVDGPRLTFSVTARHVVGSAGGEPGDVIAAGTVERAVVDRARFLARLTG
ncbi:MAG TPA: hotdog domain-containing protein [Streptosporangiaceae bacterium]|nr:hotdog domain-containing protein [Streptosporangiaceae bacterium]